MIIDLTDQWRVKVEPMNFILQQYAQTKPSKKNPEGGMKWKTYGYYSGLESALRALPDALAQCPEIETYQGYLAAWNDLARDLGGRMLR